MHYGSSTHRLHWGIAALAVALQARAVDLDYKPEPQLAGSLCWAATTQMIVDFYNWPLDGSGNPYDQARIATYAYVLPAAVAGFAQRLNECEQDIRNCNTGHDPVLRELGFDSTQTTALTPPYLTQEQITTEIDANRPIIFGWHYGNSNDINPIGHYMLIAGYHRTHSGRLRLHIYDPMPVGVGSAHIISYDNFTTQTPVNLHDDMGLPWEHAIDYYGIKPHAAPASMPIPVAATGAEAALPSLRQAVKESAPYAHGELKQLERSDYELPAGAPFKPALGEAIPVVPLTLEQLRASDPQLIAKAVRHGTARVLYPVLQDGKVLDTLYMHRTGKSWASGGYANLGVVTLAVADGEVRAHAGGQRLRPYLVSVPELGAFFVARGSGADAMLTPLATDPALRVNGKVLAAGEPLLASHVLTALHDAAMAAVAPATQRGARSTPL